MYTKVISTICIILFTLLAWAYLSLNNKKTQIEAHIIELDKIKSNLQIASKIIENGNKIILNNDFEESLKEYKNIYPTLENTPYEIDVKKRIDHIESINNEVIKSIKNEKNYESKALEHNSVIVLLKGQIDQLKSSNDLIIDSLKNELLAIRLQYENKSKEVNTLTKELSKTEKIKVLTFTNTKGNKIHYLGDVMNSKANGGGIGIWSTGSIYKGEWKNNLRHGQGTFEWSDGEKYEGEYRNDIRSGEGTYYWPSGERYFGEWDNDKRNGYGTLYDRDGNITYKGQWLNDKISDNKN